MFGPDGMRRIMSQETLKPQRTGDTLKRFGVYFKPFIPVLLLIAIFAAASTWTQVTNPELVGQLVDCYLTPAASSAFAGADPANASAQAGTPAQASTAAQANCWLLEDTPARGLTQNVIKGAYTLGGFPAPLDSMTAGERLAGLGRLVLIIVVLHVLGAVLTGATFFTMAWTGQHVLRTLRIDIFRHLHRLSLSYYSEHEAGDLMSRITNDTETIQQAINFALINVFSGILLLVWIGYNMLAKSVALALLSLVVVPLMAAATLWFSAQARKAFRKTRKEMGSVNAELQESISAVREVQAFNRERANLQSFMATNAANRDANIKAVAFTSALAPALEALGYLALAIVTCVGGLALLRDQPLFGSVVSLGLVITFLGYVQRFNQPIQQIAVLWTNIQSAIAGGERIFGLLDVEPGIQDAPGARPIAPIQGKVEFQNVTAGYNDELAVLKGISFTAEPGQTIAIVGPTGAGKTTLINLIPRFYDVSGGAVLIDDQDVRFVVVESLRKQIGIVLQDTFLFSDSVIENIRFGRPDATDAEVIAAARLAHAHTFIERLPEGFDTLLGERGSGLSHGQRQLLSIARAALSNPRLLILDEATSSVDTRTERLIQKALEELLKGRTSFVIAHRLSTIRNADLLLVMNEGQIIECGKHEELLEKRGFYYDLYMSQFRREPAVLESPAPGSNGGGTAEVFSRKDAENAKENI